METGDQAFLSYRELLRWLCEHGPTAPQDIAESRRRENVIRLQCRDLCNCGLVKPETHDVYTLTDDGYEYVVGDLKLPEADGDLAIDTLRTEPRWQENSQRITDFSGIDAETIIQFNFDRYEDSRDRYGLVRDSHELTKQRIGNVSESDLRRVMREFPRSDPLVQQCTHWVRALSGLHLFPDANHRTAIGSLRALLSINDISPPDGWPGYKLDRTIIKAKFVRSFVVDVRFDTLWRRDELYHVWHRHFRNLFYELEDTRYHMQPTERLRRALNAARMQG